MSCCGGQRARAAAPAAPSVKATQTEASTGGAAAVPTAPRPAAFVMPTSARIYFRYIGATALTVFGSASQARYRFTAPGMTIGVDPRDAPGLARVPHLERVNRP